MNNSLIEEWKKTSSRFEKMIHAAKPPETVKKCWFRSNKTLSVTFQEFDQAYKDCFIDGVVGEASIKKRESCTELLKKRRASVEKMASLYFKDLETAYKNESDKQKKKDNKNPDTLPAFDFLRKGLAAIMTDAAGRVAEAESMLRQLKATKQVAKMEKKGAKKKEVFDKKALIEFARDVDDYCVQCTTKMAYCEAACIKLLEKLHGDAYEKSKDAYDYSPCAKAYNKHIRSLGIVYIRNLGHEVLGNQCGFLEYMEETYEYWRSSADPTGKVMDLIRITTEKIEKWDEKHHIDDNSDYNKLREAITSFRMRLLKEDIKPNIEKIKSNLKRLIKESKNAR